MKYPHSKIAMIIIASHDHASLSTSNNFSSQTRRHIRLIIRAPRCAKHDRDYCQYRLEVGLRQGLVGQDFQELLTVIRRITFNTTMSLWSIELARGALGLLMTSLPR